MNLSVQQELAILAQALGRLESGFQHLPGAPGQRRSVSGDQGKTGRVGVTGGGADPSGALSEVLDEVALRLRDNYPYFHPLYAGQMLKPPHPVARLAYNLAQTINPNNHALDGGRASSAMEKEAVAQLAAVFDWSEHLGHLTSGGTVANLEALWVAGKLTPGKTVLASSQAHYTHSRVSDVLQLPFESVTADSNGRMDTSALEARLQRGDVGTVVASVGTTGFGAVDPLPDILRLRQQYGFRLHADAAYGGYFRLVEGLDVETARSLASLDSVDSIVIDPHKHGLQPYGCGAVLFADPSVGALYQHESPYTYFSSDSLHLGEISLECSRAGAAAVALWATQQLLPLETGGAFAAGLGRSIAAARQLHEKLAGDSRFLTLMSPELDIVVWAPAASSASEISAGARSHFAAAAERHLHLALIEVEADMLRAHWADVDFSDAETVTCLRSCLVKPEHLDWLDDIWAILVEVAVATGTT